MSASRTTWQQRVGRCATLEPQAAALGIACSSHAKIFNFTACYLPATGITLGPPVRYSSIHIERRAFATFPFIARTVLSTLHRSAPQHSPNTAPATPPASTCTRRPGARGSSPGLQAQSHASGSWQNKFSNYEAKSPRTRVSASYHRSYSAGVRGHGCSFMTSLLCA